MSEIKAKQIINGIKEMLIKAEAITPKNAKALEGVLNTNVLQNIIDYGKQANEDDTRNESEVCEICEGSGVMKFDETDNAESLCVCK